MKRLTTILALLLPCMFWGQNNVTIYPGSQQGTIFNAVTTAQTSGCLQNQGQNIWFSNYVLIGSPTAIQYRLEYSYNSDAATCTTGTWFAMSDDATDNVQAEVVGVGAYPFVRANLVVCSGCGAGITFSSFYSTSTASPSLLNGFYNPSQQIRKVLMLHNPENNSISSLSIAAPYQSSAGFLVFSTSASFSSGCSIEIQPVVAGINIGGIINFSIPTGSALSEAIPMTAMPVTSINFSYTGCGVATRFISASYIFYPPGAPGTPGDQFGNLSLTNTNFNQEQTSSSNASVSVSLDVPNAASTFNLVRGHLFSVSAHCSAGTAQLTVDDGGTSHSINSSGTQMWSSASGEVGTTTFKFQWFPGLAASPSNGILITLGACGAGNTGTLDVQGSVF